ncbi:SDR family NAD(P)-dependent oxidoreductase [Vibrio natriegens]|uniref:SDR family NAD(P)-dependent oxidoreductase n=1 Tax=Vibrio natriegens TaxID=691 RepID=UPI00390BD183
MMIKKVLVTGGNGDIAKAISENLNQKYIVETPERNELDVSSIESVDSFFSNRSFDIVINNAGTLYSSTVVDSDPHLWIRDISVNLIGTYLVSRASVRKNKRVRVINISSTAAFNSYLDWTSYCASKAGVLKLSMGMVKDGYDVVTICPGAIDTKLRDEVDIVNPNVMTVSEGIKPIIEAVEGVYESGNVIFYRKGEKRLIENSDSL